MDFEILEKLKDFVNKPPSHFALIANPNGELTVFLGEFKRSSSPEPGKYYIFINDFFLSNPTPFLEFRNTLFIPEQTRKSYKSSGSLSPPEVSWVQQEAEFLDSFSYFREDLKNKILSKAVPISFKEGKLKNPKLQDSEISYLLNRLIIGQSGLYSYAYRENDYLIAGASPEILFNVNQKAKLISSEAVAGSIIKTHAPLSEITGKLREEHDLVVFDLIRQLEKFGNVRKGEISLKTLKGLSHLRTPLEVNFNSHLDVKELISRLHPSGALGILPRVELSHRHIKELDLSNSRGSFGAPFGMIASNADANIVVAIRNLIFEGSSVKLGAGAGITNQSDPQKELEEVLAKQEAVRVFFGIS